MSDLTSMADRPYGAEIARFTHGLLVASAPSSTDSHDGWDPRDESIHTGPASLYISALPAASGHVCMVCIGGPISPDVLELLYPGESSPPGASLTIYDPSGVINPMLPVTGKRNKIEAYGDDPSESPQLQSTLEEIS